MKTKKSEDILVHHLFCNLFSRLIALKQIGDKLKGIRLNAFDNGQENFDLRDLNLRLFDEPNSALPFESTSP